MIHQSLFISGESSGYRLPSWTHLSGTVPFIMAGRILSYSYIPHLVVVLVEHDNNLGHVVQLWDSTQIVHGSLPLLVFVFLIYTHKQSHGISNSRHLAAFSEMGLREFVSPQDNNIVRTKNTLLNLHEEKWPCNEGGVLKVRSNCIEGHYSYPYNPRAVLSTSSCKPLCHAVWRKAQPTAGSQTQSFSNSGLQNRVFQRNLKKSTRDELVLNKGPSEAAFTWCWMKSLQSPAGPLGSTRQGRPPLIVSQHC